MPVQRAPIRGPWAGITTDTPPTSTPTGFESMVNFICRKGRIRTRPGLDPSTNSAAPDNNVVLTMQSFMDVENNWHTLALTGVNAYMINTNGGRPPLLFNPMTMGSYVTQATINNDGNGYVAGDEITLQQPPGQGAIIVVDSVTNVGQGTGNIASYHLVSRGSQYVNATNVPTTTSGNGTDATFDIVTATLPSLAGTKLPYAYVKCNGRIYFSNGSVPLLYSDGSQQLKISGSVPGSPRYLAVNDSHLIGAYWSEPDTNFSHVYDYPNRVRWSTAGNFDQWDTADLSSTAGAADMIQVPDQITGLSTLGNNTYVYRTNGVSTMILTGVAANPFDIYDFSIAPKGEGCVYPYSLVSHNNVDRFIGTSDVWSFDGSNFQPLMEGRCNAMFFSQLSKVTGTVRGMLARLLDNDFPYLSYVISLPGLNTAWAQNVNDGSWTIYQWDPPSGADPSGSYDLQLIEQVYF